MCKNWTHFALINNDCFRFDASFLGCGVN